MFLCGIKAMLDLKMGPRLRGDKEKKMKKILAISLFLLLVGGGNIPVLADPCEDAANAAYKEALIACQDTTTTTAAAAECRIGTSKCGAGTSCQNVGDNCFCNDNTLGGCEDPGGPCCK